MTDKMKNSLNATLAVFTVIFLGFIATGVGYLVVKGDRVDAEQDRRLKDLEIISYNIGKECINFMDWQKRTDKEIIELWKQTPRVAKIK